MPAADPESLFTDPNPQLNANKQVAFHIERDLLEANHWDEAGKWITDRYIQHNPMVKSGLAPVVAFFEMKVDPCLELRSAATVGPRHSKGGRSKTPSRSGLVSMGSFARRF